MRLLTLKHYFGILNIVLSLFFLVFALVGCQSKPLVPHQLLCKNQSNQINLQVSEPIGCALH